jgi:hypothetical protein
MDATPAISLANNMNTVNRLQGYISQQLEQTIERKNTEYA